MVFTEKPLRTEPKKKLVSEKDLDSVLEDQESVELRSVLNSSEDEIREWNISKILKIRNSLMTVAALRIGRRSKELMTMQLGVVENAKEAEIDGEPFFIIEVSDQKGMKSGNEAPVVFSDLEFKVLKIFINQMRPRLVDKFQTNVFPIKKHMKCASKTKKVQIFTQYVKSKEKHFLFLIFFPFRA